MSESPTQREFWEKRYQANRTPWDANGTPAALQRYLAEHPGRGERVLIPGSGSGHEIGAFAQAGYAVTAIDLSGAAVAKARGRLIPGMVADVVEGDFFTFDFGREPFEVIYERTFLCALPLSLWPKIAARLTQLLNPVGRLIGFYFFGPKAEGPPFGCAPGEPDALFGDTFTRLVDVPVPASESLPLFAGAERWQERQRRGR